MKIADMMVAANARAASAGNSGLAAMIGTCTMAVNGVKMKPIAARCGSRLNNTLCDAETRDQRVAEDEAVANLEPVARLHV